MIVNFMMKEDSALNVIRGMTWLPANAFSLGKTLIFLQIWAVDYGIGNKWNACNVLKDGFSIRIKFVHQFLIIAKAMISKENVTLVIGVSISLEIIALFLFLLIWLHLTLDAKYGIGKSKYAFNVHSDGYLENKANAKKFLIFARLTIIKDSAQTVILDTKLRMTLVYNLKMIDAKSERMEFVLNATQGTKSKTTNAFWVIHYADKQTQKGSVLRVSQHIPCIKKYVFR